MHDLRRVQRGGSSVRRRWPRASAIRSRYTDPDEHAAPPELPVGPQSLEPDTSDPAAIALPFAGGGASACQSPLARRMGFEGADGAARMLAELSERRDRVRAIFDRYFAAAQGG